jgi:hypothetical protein
MEIAVLIVFCWYWFHSQISVSFKISPLVSGRKPHGCISYLLYPLLLDGILLGELCVGWMILSFLTNIYIWCNATQRLIMKNKPSFRSLSQFSGWSSSAHIFRLIFQKDPYSYVLRLFVPPSRHESPRTSSVCFLISSPLDDNDRWLELAKVCCNLAVNPSHPLSQNEGKICQHFDRFFSDEYR